MSMTHQFTDSLHDNLELCEQLMGGMTDAGKERAKRVAAKIETMVLAVRKDYPNDPAAAFGLMFALCYITRELVHIDNVGEEKSLILRIGE